MWADIVKNLAEYPSAVLTIVDDGGYPFSFRCKPEPDASSQTLRLQLPEGLSVKPGSAGLLCHKHDELLFNMKSFGVSGTLEEDNRGWILRPRRFIPGASIKPLELLKMIRNGRKTTNRFLKKRGLKRPEVPWDEIRGLYREAKA